MVPKLFKFLLAEMVSVSVRTGVPLAIEEISTKYATSVSVTHCARVLLIAIKISSLVYLHFGKQQRNTFTKIILEISTDYRKRNSTTSWPIKSPTIYESMSAPPSVACWLLFSWGGQLRFGAPRTLGQSDDIFLGAPGAYPLENVFKFGSRKCHFLHFEDTFEQNLKVSNHIWQSIF